MLGRHVLTVVLESIEIGRARRLIPTCRMVVTGAIVPRIPPAGIAVATPVPAGIVLTRITSAGIASARITSAMMASAAIAWDCRYRDCLLQDCLPQDCLPQDCLPQDCLPQDCLPQDSLLQDSLPGCLLQDSLLQDSLLRNSLPGCLLRALLSRDFHRPDCRGSRYRQLQGWRELLPYLALGPEVRTNGLRSAMTQTVRAKIGFASYRSSYPP